jgi:hypothetical protein
MPKPTPWEWRAAKDGEKCHVCGGQASQCVWARDGDGGLDPRKWRWAWLGWCDPCRQEKQDHGYEDRE